LIVFMALIPPWQETFDQKGVRIIRPAGYGCIFAPPEPSPRFGIRVDVSRLLVQWAMVTVGATLVALRPRKDPE
jgi:hypothetical protein